MMLQFVALIIIACPRTKTRVKINWEAYFVRNKEIVARIMRILTVPPIMALILVSVLAGSRPDILTTQSELAALVLLLAVIPALAYLWQKWRDGRVEREKQRDIAFVFTAVGYSTAFFGAVASHRNRKLVMICMTYFLSVSLLTVCNKWLHIRASGHACGATSPLLLLVWLTGWKALLPCMLVVGGVAWSSLYLKRHTLRELAAGGAVCIISLVFSASITTCWGWSVS